MQHGYNPHDVPKITWLISRGARPGAQTNDFKSTSWLWAQEGEGSVQGTCINIEVQYQTS